MHHPTPLRRPPAEGMGLRTLLLFHWLVAVVVYAELVGIRMPASP